PNLSAEVRPGQEEAVDIVWRSQYGQAGQSPPIFWMYEPYLDCDGGKGWLNNGVCWDGMYVHDERPVAFDWTTSGMHVELAWPGWFTRFSETSLAHELCHAAFEDWDHEGPCADTEGTLSVRAKLALEGQK